MKEPTLPPPDYRGPHTGEPFWNLMSMKAALRQATPPAQVPAGYKLVPIEPTEDGAAGMTNAGAIALKCHDDTPYMVNRTGIAKAVYKAMIEAAIKEQKC